MPLYPPASSGGSGTPAGSDQQLQFNDGGAFGAAAGLLWDSNAGALYIASAFKDIYGSGDQDGAIAIKLWGDDSGFAGAIALRKSVIDTGVVVAGGAVEITGGDAGAASDGDGGSITITPGHLDGAGTTGYIKLKNIPDSDPGVAGAVYQVDGVLMISA